MPTEDASTISYRDIGTPGVWLYEVRHGDDLVGRVRQAQLGAGQFGQTWHATTISGQQRTDFRSRDAAARWLATRVGG